MKYPLNEPVLATADANGRAVASTGPYKYGDRWVIESITTNTNSVLESQLKVYRGVESESAVVASSYSGNQDSAGGNVIRVPTGDKLVFVWSGCTPGAQCNARLEGDLETGRR